MTKNSKGKGPRPFVTPAADILTFLRGLTDATIDAGGLEEDLALAIGDNPLAIRLRRSLGKLIAAAGKHQRDPLVMIQRLAMPLPDLQRPTLEQLQKMYPFIASIKWDNSPVDPVTFRLGTILQGREKKISSAEYVSRLVPLQEGGELLSYQHLQWAVDHQEEQPGLMALLGQISIDGPGLVVVGRDNISYFPQLHEDDKWPRWRLYWKKFDGFFRDRRFARAG